MKDCGIKSTLRRHKFNEFGAKFYYEQVFALTVMPVYQYEVKSLSRKLKASRSGAAELGGEHVSTEDRCNTFGDAVAGFESCRVGALILYKWFNPRLRVEASFLAPSSRMRLLLWVHTRFGRVLVITMGRQDGHIHHHVCEKC